MVFSLRLELVAVSHQSNYTPPATDILLKKSCKFYKW